MSQTESDRFNAWWRSDERDIYPSKAHAWVVWLAATKAGRERIAELEAKLGDAVCAIDAWSDTCAPLLSPQAIIDAATFVDEARALLKGGAE
jgi:hypothetical protein